MQFLLMQMQTELLGVPKTYRKTSLHNSELNNWTHDKAELAFGQKFVKNQVSVERKMG